MIGVEDDGCHSMLTYEDLSESARVVECIARSLNAVVVDRVMIQGEILFEGNTIVKEINKDARLVRESPVFGMDSPMNDDGEQYRGQAFSPAYKDSGMQQQLALEPSLFTRAEITIQRVETHLLDPSPLSLVALATSSASTTGNGDNYQPEGRQLNIGPDSEPAVAIGNATTVNPSPHMENHHSISETLSARNIRVAVVGNVDAGKSTLIGTITNQCLDDGRGKCRTSIMKHRHEIESGRTSTATTHLMGFRSTGEPITAKDKVKGNKRKTEDEIAMESYRIITLMDLAGHEKYLKTT